MSLPFWAVALLGFLIVARITRFLNADYLFAPIRDRVEGWSQRGKVWYLLSCAWCASIYIALPVALLAVLTLSPYSGWTAVWVAGGLWLGYSWLYGLVATNLDDE